MAPLGFQVMENRMKLKPGGCDKKSKILSHILFFIPNAK